MKNVGYLRAGSNVYSYQIGGSDIFSEENTLSTKTFVNLFKVDAYTIYPNGDNNLAPNIIRKMVADNRLLPELIDKKVKMLYGHGPHLFISHKDGTKVWREYLEVAEINDWLDGWRERGLSDDYKRYLLKAIKSYYYENCVYSKYRLTRGASIKIGLPIAGLEVISPVRARLATTLNLSNRTDILDSDFNHVIVGNWECLSMTDYEVFPRFDYAQPLLYPSAVACSKDWAYGDEVYSRNEWFAGIKEWIKGSNLTPSYINDYLRNALSARMHIVIPNRWVTEKRKQLEDLCALNFERAESSEPLLKVKYENGDIEVGTEYSENILMQCINMELQRLTEYLSGEGKNQGKVYSSISYQTEDKLEERWKIEDIPQKYKEYIEALTNYDKRADEVMLSAIGLDPSISNVTKDGIISKSGSDAYYNYLIYLNSLTIAEEIVCSEINNAIKLNFPEQYKKGIRLGFYKAVVDKQQDVPEQNRITNQNEEA